jgi:hypothetical protein
MVTANSLIIFFATDRSLTDFSIAKQLTDCNVPTYLVLADLT